MVYTKVTLKINGKVSIDLEVNKFGIRNLIASVKPMQSTMSSFYGGSNNVAYVLPRPNVFIN